MGEIARILKRYVAREVFKQLPRPASASSRAIESVAVWGSNDTARDYAIARARRRLKKGTEGAPKWEF